MWKAKVVFLIAMKVIQIDVLVNPNQNHQRNVTKGQMQTQVVTTYISAMVSGNQCHVLLEVCTNLLLATVMVSDLYQYSPMIASVNFIYRSTQNLRIILVTTFTFQSKTLSSEVEGRYLMVTAD